MRIIEYEAISWRVEVPSNEGYDLSEVSKLFADLGIRSGLTSTIKRYSTGFVADGWREIRWHEEYRDGIKTMVIDLHRRLRRRQGQRTLTC